ncbi:hypothetical protein JCM16161A_23590 [Vulcanisaeta sp. JCM 16161]|uniref:hypothetical protein n=1 Tax=Vulcanisaeta sp. JCM 16161 TaxID=1295372 RepID=UPI000AAC6C7C|nr:hypothetical protein [Vulcanisaeta sp. JCM 16161]
MIRYLLTSILIIMMFIMIIIIEGFLLKMLHLTVSVSNYAVVTVNGSRGLLGIP